MSHDTKKRYWKGIEEREQTPDFEEASCREFPQSLPEDAESAIRSLVARF